MAKAKKKAKKAEVKKSKAKKTTAKKSVSKKKVTKAKAKPKAKVKKAAAKSQAKAKAKKPEKKKAAAKKIAPKKSAAQKALPKKAEAKRSESAIDVSKIFTPLDDRVLIRRDGVSNMTPGGLYIPETVSASDRPSRGTVLAVGPGHRDKKGRLRPLDVKAGDQVMFNSYAGSEVIIGGAEYLILREDEIIAVTN